MLGLGSLSEFSVATPTTHILGRHISLGTEGRKCYFILLILIHDKTQLSLAAVCPSGLCKNCSELSGTGSAFFLRYNAMYPVNLCQFGK